MKKIFLLTLFTFGLSETIYIPQDYPTIQLGIDAAEEFVDINGYDEEVNV